MDVTSFIKAGAKIGIMAAGAALAPVTGGASLAAAGGIASGALDPIIDKAIDKAVTTARNKAAKKAIKEIKEAHKHNQAAEDFAQELVEGIEGLTPEQQEMAKDFIKEVMQDKDLGVVKDGKLQLSPEDMKKLGAEIQKGMDGGLKDIKIALERDKGQAQDIGIQLQKEQRSTSVSAARGEALEAILKGSGVFEEVMASLKAASPPEAANHDAALSPSPTPDARGMAAQQQIPGEPQQQAEASGRGAA